MSSRERPVRFLSSVVDTVVGSRHNENLEVVVLPPASGDQPIDSDEEEDNLLDEDFLPEETVGELEVHRNLSDNEEDDEATEVASSQWRKCETLSLGEVKSLQQPQSLLSHHGKNMEDIFDLFFSKEMIDLIVEQTNLYAKRDKNDPTFETNICEMRKFLGLLIMSGYHYLPSEKDYWSTSDDMEAPIFRKTMSRDCFRAIKKYLHVADNHHLQESKVAKVLPLLEKLRTNCLQFGIFHQELSIDESMVLYRGQHSAKQVIKSKPIKFGYKLWMLCSSDGFPYSFEVYCGKDSSRTQPLGAHVVKKMVAEISKPDQHIVYFDNFFTSHRLLTDLAQLGIRACGTIRANRTNNCPLPSKKIVEKQPPGYFDFQSDKTVLCTIWNDNCAVSVASNYYGVSPMKNVTRRVKNGNPKKISQPYLIAKYNAGMGGVDVCDRMLSSYRPWLRSRKWWWNLFAHTINLAIVASFRFYCLVNEATQTSHLEFRREVARSLVKAEVARQRPGGPSAPPVKAARYDGINHILQATQQGRCVLCQKNTRLSCQKCEKRLHKNCSVLYHTR